MNHTDQQERTEGDTTLTGEQLIEMYRWMVTVRHFDRRAVNLQRSGRIGTYAPLEGQEAAQVGCGYALEKQDWLFPTYREHGVSMVHGVPMTTVFLYWNGRPEGCMAPEGVTYFPSRCRLPRNCRMRWARRGPRSSRVKTPSQ